MARTSPAPNVPPIPGMCPGVAVMGGGGGGGGAGGKGSKKGKGKKGAGKKKGKKNASGNKKKGGCASGDPICPLSGRVLLELFDFGFNGPLPFRFERNYSSTRADMAGDLGFGWSHTLAVHLEIQRRSVALIEANGLRQEMARPAPGHTESDGFGGVLWADPAGTFELRTEDEVFEFAAPVGGRAWLVGIRDRRGNRHEIERATDGRLLGWTDSAGRRYRVGSDAAGRIVSIAVALDGEGSQWMTVMLYRYDEAGNLACATDAEEFPFTYEYDEEHLLLAHRSPNGRVVRYAYQGRGVDAKGVRTWVTLSDEASRFIDFSTARPEVAARRSVVDRELEFDPQNHYGESLDGLGRAMRFFGDEANRLVKLVDRVGAVTTYVYDEASGAKIQEVAPDGTVRDIAGGGRGHVSAEGLVERWPEQDGSEVTLDTRRNAIVRRVFDAEGDLVFIEHPDGTREEFTYDSRGCLVGHVDRQGRGSRYVHDAMGNCVEIWSPSGVERYDHDYLGRTIRHVDARGRITEFVWDRRNEPIRKTYPDGSMVEAVWDADRLPVRVNDAGRVREFDWTGFGWLGEVRQGSELVLRQIYDVEGNLIAVENGRSQRFSMTRDGAGRCVQHRTFEGIEVDTSFDVMGNPVCLDGPQGVIALTFGGGSLMELAAPDVAIAIVPGLGRPRSVDNGVVKVEWETDALGRVVSERQGRHEVQVDWQAGQLHKVVSDAGLAVHFRDEGRTTRIGDHSLTRGQADRADAACSWDLLGSKLLLRKRTNACNYVVEAALFDANGKLLSERRYRYNDAQALVGVREGRDEITFVLDHRDRVVRRTHERGTTVVRDERFAFDAAGGVLMSGVRLDDLGRPVEVHGEVWDYDLAGRLVCRHTDRGDVHLSWNALDQLVKVTSPDALVSYEYDGSGRRMGKRVERDGVLVKSVDYIWCNDLLFREIDRISGRIRTYFLDHNRWEVFGHVDQLDPRDEGRAYYYLTGPDGVVDRAVDADGREVFRAHRGLFGDGEPELRDVDVTVGFVGQHWDEDVGLYYNRFRWYEPRAARYLSPDPYLLAGNLLPRDYVENPTRFCDPLGAWVHPGVGSGTETSTGGTNNRGFWASPENPVAPRPAPYTTTGPVNSPARQATSRYLSGPGHWANNTPPPPDTPAGRTPGYANCPHEALHEGEGFGDYRNPNSAQGIVDAAGNRYGCHSCGSKNSGQTNPDGTQHWTCDHQPPRSTYNTRNSGRASSRSNTNASRSARPGGESEAVRLYPHCVNCSTAQMRTTSGSANSNASVGGYVAAGNRQMTLREAQIRQQRAAEERAARRGQWDYED